MKLLTTQQIRDWDQYTIEHTPITSAALMEHAASVCADKIYSLFQRKLSFTSVAVFCGVGNNGGDGLVITRLLHLIGIPVSVYLVGDAQKRSPDCTIQLGRLPKPIQPVTIEFENNLPELTADMLVVDALLGSGLNRAAEGIMALTIDKLNRSQAYIVSVDIPSGLPAQLQDQSDLSGYSVVKAHTTFTFQLPKLSFLHAESYAYTGNWEVLDIGLLPEYMSTVKSPYHWVGQTFIQPFLKQRLPFSHKGSFGHVLIAGGSYGKLGAALLASKAALRTGCGLVTALVPKVGFTVVQTALPEVMVQTDDELYELRNFPETSMYAAIGVGPGLGTHAYTEKGLKQWLAQLHQPVVMDADALNICARLLQQNPSFKFPSGCILTPHPKEFDRLAGFSVNSYERQQKQLAFAARHKVVVVLKGAYTTTATPEGELFYNSSGNVALATAGSGDVLTGIITSLLAQQYTPQQAAVLGVYLHGVCADMWVQKGNQTMIAGDIVEMIPSALHRLFN